jgi:hypothetical protein
LKALRPAPAPALAGSISAWAEEPRASADVEEAIGRSKTVGGLDHYFNGLLERFPPDVNRLRRHVRHLPLTGEDAAPWV